MNHDKLRHQLDAIIHQLRQTTDDLRKFNDPQEPPPMYMETDEYRRLLDLAATLYEAAQHACEAFSEIGFIHHTDFQREASVNALRRITTRIQDGDGDD